MFYLFIQVLIITKISVLVRTQGGDTVDIGWGLGHGRIFQGGFGGVQTPPGSGKHPPRKC